MSTHFFLDARANKQGEFPIRMSINLNGAKFSSTLGCSVSREAWADAALPDLSYRNSRGVSAAEMKEKMSRLNDGLQCWEWQLRGRRPDSGEIRRRIGLILKGEAPLADDGDLADRLEEFFREQRKACQWADGTVRSLDGFRRHLLHFGQARSCDFFDRPGLEAWLRYLRDTGLEESTVRKQYGCLCWFLRWAHRKGYLTESAVLSFRPKFKRVAKPVIFLTKQELLRLYSMRIPASGTLVRLRDNKGGSYLKEVRNADGLEKARDIFCFCAFTSLRYSDASRLRWSDVSQQMIYVTTQKTQDRLPIDLCAKAQELLSKYAQSGRFPTRPVFPPLSNQKMNRYLKDLCELARIDSPVVRVSWRNGQRNDCLLPKWALVGTHAARRSFICLALSQGIPPQVVMKWTGHSDYKSMHPYIDIAVGVKAAAMRKFSAALER